MTKGRKNGSGRDPGGFSAIPWLVQDCPAYSRLSHPARSLLFEFARQFVGDNNGRLLASAAYLGPRGWKSKDVITRAKRELLDAGFIYETVKGLRPSKASWYAMTWHTLDKLDGYDAGAAAGFVRGAYQKNVPLKNTRPRPSHGPAKTTIGPSYGLESTPSGPPHGPVETLFTPISRPPHGHHLEIPSVASIKTRH